MRIHTEDKDVRGLLDAGYIRVSKIQRSYDWVMGLAKTFWTETVANSRGSMFVGSIMLYSVNKGVFRVAHGQHKIAMVILALCAVRNAFKDIGCNEQADEIQKLIQKQGEKNKGQWVLQSEKARPYIHDDSGRNENGGSHPLNIEAEDKNLEGAYEYINDQIQQQRIAIYKDPNMSAADKEQALRQRLTEIENSILSARVTVATAEPIKDSVRSLDGRIYQYCRMCGGSGEYREYKPCSGCQGKGVVKRFWLVRLWNKMVSKGPKPLGAWA